MRTAATIAAAVALAGAALAGDFDLGLDSTEALRREAKARAKIERAKPSPHSNIGILLGDLQGQIRLAGMQNDPTPEWAVLRLEELALIVAPTNAPPAATVTNK